MFAKPFSWIRAHYTRVPHVMTMSLQTISSIIPKKNPVSGNGGRWFKRKLLLTMELGGGVIWCHAETAEIGCGRWWVRGKYFAMWR